MTGLTLNFTGTAPAAAPEASKLAVTIPGGQPTPQVDKDGNPRPNGAISVHAEEPETPAPSADEYDKMDHASLLKAAKELRSKMSSVKPEAKPEEKPEAKPEEKPALTPEQQAKADKYNAAVEAAFSTAAGGADKVPAVLEWANTSLAPESAEAFNAALDSGNAVLARNAIAILHKAYVDANGTEPSVTVKGAPAGSDGVQPFGDTSEMTAAMRDPRYSKSENYRKQVAARIALSRF